MASAFPCPPFPQGTTMTERITIGLMSGTSLDGTDAVEIGRAHV